MIKTSLLLIALILLTITSCFKEPIDLNLNEGKKKIVITGWISSLDEAQHITISETVNYLGDELPKMISNAIATIQNGNEIYNLVEQQAGMYYLPTDWVAKVGSTYQLQVEHEGLQYTAMHKMHPCPEIERTKKQFVGTRDSIEQYDVVFSFTDFPGEGNAYFGVDFLKGSAAGDILANGSFTDDQFLDGEELTDVSLTSSNRRYQLGDTAIIELHSIGKESSDFLQEIENSGYSDSPFDPTPSNLKTNITGGAVGYFIVSDVRQAMVVIE